MISGFKSCLFILLTLVVFIPKAQAGISTIQAMSFGSFALKDNTSQYDIVINTDGSYSYDADGFVLVTPPQEGIYDFTGLDPLRVIGSVVITQVSSLVGGSSPGGFQMVDLQEDHPAATDASGVARITVGGTARSDGGGLLYHDDTFTGTLRITINF